MMKKQTLQILDKKKKPVNKMKLEGGKGKIANINVETCVLHLLLSARTSSQGQTLLFGDGEN